MEEDKEYINALSVIRELEEQLAYLNDTSLLQKVHQSLLNHYHICN